MTVAAIALAAAFVAAEGGEELEDFQTTESKGFREIATSGFTIYPYPAVSTLDVDAARERHEFLALGDKSIGDSIADQCRYFAFQNTCKHENPMLGKCVRAIFDVVSTPFVQGRKLRP